ncbi:LppX_LprAFG lipoprotein [Planotetraspora sp. A-T 1434]|uniref:LppX_LprAFG lipoprotein n=1 Tax=Planotetraspora sp. A-T 1434 TaxID=2979219 RepID=UPI0021C1DFF0|nr:LppX_LprAFG lipoprotein [Planotetraspora sp. A-T 1434]MCT9930499.1 LppX_LprAFG lipoprotein [Planotetraspora sp. A-T 1434]
MRRIVWLVMAALLLATACSSKSEAAIPSGADLLKRSAEAMKTVKTVAFTIETKDRPAVPVRHAEGSLTKEGDAKGTLQIDFGGLQEFEFVLAGDTVHFKGPTGGFQTMTRQQLAAIYDPSAVLTGVPELLSTAKDPRSEAVEKVGGADAYRVAVTLAQQVLAKLIPGVQQGVNGTLWIDKATSRLVKIDLPLNGGSVAVTLSDYDAPVTITPPAS